MPMPTATAPTASEATAPRMTRESRSRPYWSVPIGWLADGGSSRAVISMRRGSRGV